jgi:spore germination cell wall hydrolase CwlJ-like protein
MKILILLLISASTIYADSKLDVAWTIYKEAEGELSYGQRAVATVIYNRSVRRNLSYSQVVRQPQQFSPWNSGKEPSVYYNEVFEYCMKISEELHNGTFVPMGPWDHFFNPDKCTPYWYKFMTNRCIIGHHLFGIVK